MLPDYPKTKAKLLTLAAKLIESGSRAELPPIDDIPSTIAHEGDRSFIQREDGSEAEIEMNTIAVDHVMKTLSGNVEDVDIAELGSSLIEVGRKMGREQGRVFLRAIETAVAEVGNVIGPSPDPIEQIFTMIKKRMFDFDAEGKPLWGQVLVGNVETAERFKRTMSTILTTKELNQRYELLIEEKRREFIDREAARKLVD
jgi:hypothetical protein